MSKLTDFKSLLKTYGAYRQRVEVCDYTPTRIWVEAASHCNLRCSFCANKDLDKGDRGFMDLGLFRKIADESAGRVKQFNLFHRGESLLHPHIGEMIDCAVSRGIRTRINTNATRLTEDTGRRLIESGLDILSFSFDGYDPEMYERNRPNAEYDKVLANILHFLRLKRELRAAKPFVSIEVMELADHTPAEFTRMRSEFMQQFRELPLDKLVIRKPHNWGGAVDPGGSGEGRSEQNRIACPLLWHALVVFWDGRVFPCPQDFFGKLQLGDVTRQSLTEIWNGPELRALRREMADPNRLSTHPCTECDRIVRATVAGIPVDYLGRFLSENLFGRSWLSRILPH